MTRGKAKLLRQLIESLAIALDDETALTGVELFQMWAIGRAYAVDDRVQYNGALYKCVQAHTSQDGWEPENVPALFTEITESHAGTMVDPIPYNNNMELTEGMYYSQGGVTYRCTRSTGQPVYNALADLVGLYVEVV